ncbi:metal-dependent hydrolase [Larsenimonas rhizosphaerae]|uniref:Metal-dependent hydrolase n=1 Tax=Larsenimonas rhizosphaerae TaxID=2944682 RepID=A0AA42CUL8_9GAMM|nr:metal-dependent hydrolase [Larsenimonas rhizosphaerae]MCM2129849.1 metal-dependent hydrolase [Larsenimonas rhizosphaerae]MCX2524509.1 metal-dependent hydrolase [Larsenimonas rhizosphaerae]
MDSITQAALGATLGGAVLGRPLGRKALIGGALLGTLPDMDVLISHGSAIADFTGHRGFSHSLLVLTVLAALMTLGLSRWRRTRHIPAHLWWWFCFLPLITHPLLDALTAYGTRLFWPLNSPPIALDTLFIIDPLYTLPLLLGVLITLVRPSLHRSVVIGLALSTLYMGWAITAKQIIRASISPVLIDHRWQQADRFIQPMPMTTFLWRVVVLEGDRRHESYVSIFDDAPPRFDTFRRFPENAVAATHWPEARRLLWFTQGRLMFRAQGDQLIATDLRMGLPGREAFRFAIARRDNTHWTPVDSTQAQGPGYSADQLSRVWQRLFTPGALCPATYAPPALVIERQCQPPADR